MSTKAADLPAPALTPWPHDDPPTEQAIERIFREEALRPSWWSNGPGDRYGSHSHPYHKILYCASGSIRFVAGSSGAEFDLRPGDRLEIPPKVTHSAMVGPEGVRCVEAART